MRTAKRGFAEHEWLEVEPKLKRDDHSATVLERLANLLRPKVKIGKRLSWEGTVEKSVETPSDLMSIDFEIEDSVSTDDVLAAWPNHTAAEIDEALLLQLTTALRAALADAIDVGVESNESFSISDLDVPSVAQHRQNDFRSGFQVIVRVLAEIWTRLTTKSPARAIAMAERWRDSPFRLMRRLALFAFADLTVPAQFGVGTLARLAVRGEFSHQRDG